jgi:hypothetical protein
LCQGKPTFVEDLVGVTYAGLCNHVEFELVVEIGYLGNELEGLHFRDAPDQVSRSDIIDSHFLIE